MKTLNRCDIDSALESYFKDYDITIIPFIATHLKDFDFNERLAYYGIFTAFDGDLINKFRSINSINNGESISDEIVLFTDIDSRVDCFINFQGFKIRSKQNLFSNVGITLKTFNVSTSHVPDVCEFVSGLAINRTLKHNGVNQYPEIGDKIYTMNNLPFADSPEFGSAENICLEMGNNEWLLIDNTSTSIARDCPK